MKWGIYLGGLLGRVGYYLVYWERKQAISNLRMVFGNEKRDKEIRHIAKRMFINLGYSMAELAYLPRLSPEYLRSHIRLEGKNYFNELQAQGKGSLAITGHFGNWEMMGAYFSQIEHSKFSVIARTLSNEYLDRILMSNRQRWGVRALPRGGSASAILRAIREGQTVGILVDQDTRGEGIFVDFFGRPAYTQTGPAVIALKWKIPLIPVFMVRSPHNPLYHTIYIEPPLSFELTGDWDTDISVITHLFTERVESYIRRYPEQWVWFHRRWKTVPRNGGEVKKESSK